MDTSMNLRLFQTRGKSKYQKLFMRDYDMLDVSRVSLDPKDRLQS